MKQFIISLIICVLASVAVAQSQFASTDSTYQQFGKLLRLKVSRGAFPEAKRAEGHSYQGKQYTAAQHYSDSTVLVFVPKKFAPRGAADVVVYMHGWYNNVDSSLVQFKLIDQFVQADKNALLIMPETARNAPDSYGGNLEKAGGLGNLLTEVFTALIRLDVLRSTKVGSVVLAGHSGAYRPMAYMLMHGGVPVSEAYVLDGLYGQVEKFGHWLFQNKNARLVNIYTDEGGTKQTSEDFMETLRAWGLSFANLKENEATLADLEKQRITFIHSTDTHNAVVSPRNSFYKYLASSAVLKNLGE